MDKHTTSVNLCIALRAQGSTQTFRRNSGSSRCSSRHVLCEWTRGSEENRGIFSVVDISNTVDLLKGIWRAK